MIGLIFALAAAEIPPPPTPVPHFAVYEACTGLAAAMLEAAASPTSADRENYVAWTGAYTNTALYSGYTPNEIDVRLDAARAEGLKTLATPDAAERVLYCSRLFLHVYVPTRRLRSMSQ
jgi:hypothetical protein